MRPFNPELALPGTVLLAVDAASLYSSKDSLERWRVDLQHELLATHTRRWDIIEGNRDGVILAGHHGARAAAEARMPVDVLIRDLPIPSQGPILSIPVVSRLSP